MAQARKTGKQPQDPYAQRGKVLASAVKRLQGWVGSDPSKGVELADALVELTGHRLLGHAFTAAAADATEAVRRSAEQLTVNGPLGPYTALDDAVRFVTAVAHLATVQVGLGLPDTAGRTIEALPGLRDQLTQLPLAEQLDPSTVVYILMANARAALTADDPAGANAYVDAALSRRAEAGLAGDDLAYLRLDVDRLAADARWVAGRADESLTHLHAAKDGYAAFVAGRLSEPGRLPPALVERLAEPLFGLYSDMADRLATHGDTDLGLVTRRELIGLLHGLVKPVGQPARTQLSLALGDLARDLERSDRLSESAAAAAEAAELASGPGSAASVSRRVHDLGATPITWTPLSATDAYAATTAGAGGLAPTAQDAERQQETAAWLTAERAEAHRLEQQRLAEARAQAERQAAEQAEAERVAATERAAQATRAAEAKRIEAEQQAAAAEAERRETKRRREERLEQHRLEVERREAERRAAEGGADGVSADDEPVQAEPEPLVVKAPVAPEPEPEPVVPEVPVAPEPELVIAEVTEPVTEPEAPVEPDAVAIAQQAWQEARARGERRAARAALEEYVELLRPRAQDDLPAYGSTLVQALEELSSARLRGGDLFGSRAPAREAKALARSLRP